MRVLGFAAVLLGLLVSLAFAGDPRYVAGASYFDPAVKGMPITWAGGQLSYYTDQGQLSALLPHANADAMVADSFARWTSVPTAALSATQSGQLSEDVNGTNVPVDATGAITVPLDIQPTATDKPVAIIYDADGAVTDAFLGAGECSFESLDSQAATAFGCLQLAAGVVELGVEVGLLRRQ